MVVFRRGSSLELMLLVAGLFALINSPNRATGIVSRYRTWQKVDQSSGNKGRPRPRDGRRIPSPDNLHRWMFISLTTGLSKTSACLPCKTLISCVCFPAFIFLVFVFIFQPSLHKILRYHSNEEAPTELEGSTILKIEFGGMEKSTQTAQNPEAFQ